LNYPSNSIAEANLIIIEQFQAIYFVLAKQFPLIEKFEALVFFIQIHKDCQYFFVQQELMIYR
jgi:hypothetical protein